MQASGDLWDNPDDKDIIDLKLFRAEIGTIIVVNNEGTREHEQVTVLFIFNNWHHISFLMCARRD